MSDTPTFLSSEQYTPPLDSLNPVGRLLLRRQPIYRPNMNEFGYQLLYGRVVQHWPATPGALMDMLDIGLDELVGHHIAFINVARQSILGKHYQCLPEKRVALDLLEPIELDERFLLELSELKSKGYLISIGDFANPQAAECLLEFANFVRLNVRGKTASAIARRIDQLRKHPVAIIGERIETRPLFQHCKQLGIDLVQGNFFTAPQQVAGVRIPVNRLSTLHLLALFNNPRITIEKLEDVMRGDPVLCYKLLRYVKSAICGLDRRIETLRHAMMLVGLEKIQNWASLLLFSGFQDTPRDVIATGIIRARMCEQLGTKLGLKNPDRLFLVGLFSILDVILYQPLARILSSLPLAAEIHDAILYEKGELGAILQQVLAYEREDHADLQNRTTAAPSVLPSHPDYIQRVYQEAVEWSLRTLRTFEVIL